jgi:translocation and assembly module TamB
MAGEPITAEEREARIAALRTRRRARMRRLTARSLLLLLALFALSLVVGYALFNSLRGRDVLLGQIVARLPDGTTLTWSRAEGTVSGPLVLHDVRYVQLTCSDRDGRPVAWPGCEEPLRTTFRAARIELDPSLQPLLGRRLRLDALRVIDATLVLPRDDAPFELPRWPQSLPAIEPPLALEADAIAIDRLSIVREGGGAGSDAVASDAVVIRSASGGVRAERGRLTLRRIAIDSDVGRFTLHGDYLPRERYRMDLTASALLPAAAGRTPARLGLVARGDLRALDIALAGHAPAPLRAHLRLRGEARPVWNATAQSERLTLGALLGSDDDVPMAFDLRSEGEGGVARLQGRASRDGVEATILPSTVSVEGQILRVAPLRIAVLGGSVAAHGRADFRDPENARFEGRIEARALRWQGADKTAPTIIGDGDFEVGGGLRAWTAEGDARLQRDRGGTVDRAEIALLARGDGRGARFERLRATMPGGRLDGGGTLSWSPTLRWNAQAQLRGVDPGYVLPDWRGAIDATLRTRGETRKDGGLDIEALATDLGGQLRGRRLSGRADLRFGLPARSDGRTDVEGEIALSIGASRIDARGRIDARYDLDARLTPLQLADLHPQAQGQVRGTLRLTGPRAQPEIDADLDGRALRWQDWRAQSLQVRGRLPWRAGTRGALTVAGSDVDAGLALRTVRLRAEGAVEALRVDGEADTEFGALALAGSLARRGAGWEGALDALRLAPTQGPAWTLQAPARFATTPIANGWRLRLPTSCFAASDPGLRLCADVDWPQRVDVRGAALPLNLLAPYLPEREPGRRWTLRGSVDLDAKIRPQGGSWRGEARLRADAAALALDARGRNEVLAVRDLRLEARFDPHRFDAELAAALAPDGRVSARIDSGWDADAPLRGEVDVDTRALTWLELFSPDIVEPAGRLEGRIALGGSRARPTLGGQARLTDFTAELPALALSLREGDVRLDAQPDGSATIAGRVRSGEGTLRVDGTLGWQSDDTPLRLAITGEDVLISDTRQLRAVVDPAVVVRWTAGAPIAVAGRVRIDSAKFDLERLDAGVSASEDVVVLDPVDPERGAATLLDLDLALEMGEDVRLHGFGLDGSLGGSVRMRARPGRETVATGSLDVAGRYRAYGQNLAITRGRLLWSNTAFADPLLDVRAEREIGNITAGIDVRGRASAPEATVWSDPATSESEALAYLALGRPLSTASADENRRLSAATAALSAGNLLASQLGAKIGLDDAGVSESRALGGTVVGIGKYLSPRLYVGYGVSLLGTGQVLTLKYLLRKGFDIEIESSTVENRGSVNWRREK